VAQFFPYQECNNLSFEYNAVTKTSSLWTTSYGYIQFQYYGFTTDLVSLSA